MHKFLIAISVLGCCIGSTSAFSNSCFSGDKGGFWCGVNVADPVYPAGTLLAGNTDPIRWVWTDSSEGPDGSYVYATGSQLLVDSTATSSKGRTYGWVEERVNVIEGCDLGIYITWANGGPGANVYTGFDPSWAPVCPLKMADGTTQLYALCFHGDALEWGSGGPNPNANLMFVLPQNVSQACGYIGCSPANGTHCDG